MEIFQAIIEDPTIRRLLGNYDSPRSESELNAMMDDLGLNAEERRKFREAYQDFQKDPHASYESYKYKYEPKSNNPFDKFDAYFQKFEDQAKSYEDKYGKGTGNWSHRQYKKYRDAYGSQGGQGKGNFGSSSGPDPMEKKHYEALDLKPGASFDEIKSAYKKQMKKYHPDRFANSSMREDAEKISRKINAAYDYFKKKFNKS